MRPFLFHILFLFVLCFALANCKHEPPPEEPKVCQYDSSVEEMKKWYYFKEGTQWIYQEQTTGELDTVTVYDSEDGIDWFEYYEYHSYGGWIVDYWHDPSWSIPCITQQECTCHKIFRSRFKPGNYVGESRPFLFPAILGDYIGDHGGLNSALSFQDTLSQQGETYINVIHWDVPEDASEGYVHVQYWVAQHVGIFRKINYENNTDWQLIEYLVMQ